MKLHLLLLLPVLVAAGVAKITRNSYVLSGGSTVTINGTSNLRVWKETVGTVTGVMEAQLYPDGSIGIASIRICMEAGSIKSDMGRVMDKKTPGAAHTRKKLRNDHSPKGPPLAGRHKQAGDHAGEDL